MRQYWFDRAASSITRLAWGKIWAYRQRTFFDWGGWLAVRPMGERRHWRVVMRRERDSSYGDSRILCLSGM